MNKTIPLFLTDTYPCSYLPDQQAASQLAVPAEGLSAAIYDALITQGFRRSGIHAYRPHCAACNACISVRVPVAQFTKNRSQRRAWKQHQHLVACSHLPHFDQEHFALYCDYQQTRHPDGDMANDDPSQYTQFLLRSPIDSRLVTFHDPHTDRLVMVSLIDLTADGLSAVYTFYATTKADRGAAYGVYNVLWQITQAQLLNVPYVYLGYWIEQSPKMAYKKSFQPLEVYIDGMWQPYTADTCD